MKRILAGVLAGVLFFSGAAASELGVEVVKIEPQVATAAPMGPKVDAGAALLMEQETGEVLLRQNEHDKLEPASVTKVMTLLLCIEAVDEGRLGLADMIAVSENAAGMGGSQVYLKEGEAFSADDMLKAVAVVSGNDAAVAMAEHLMGSEDAFVARMNERAGELGMQDTHFENCTGLPAGGHLTSAYDIALMSRELMRHDSIKKYTTIWIDSIRDGAFQLANTNKLVRFYEGATGLKTGSTDSALYCLSATAERDGMELIAVILKAPSSNVRFDGAKALLNFGFANYTLYDVRPNEALPPVDVLLGQTATVQPELRQQGRILIEKSQVNNIDTSISLASSVEAPVEKGQKLGELTVNLEGKPQQVLDIVASDGAARLGTLGIFKKLAARLFMCAA